MIFKPNYRHKKRGTEYMIICESLLQMEGHDYLEMITYIDKEGKKWTRSKIEFFDGRFEEIKFDEQNISFK